MDCRRTSVWAVVVALTSVTLLLAACAGPTSTFGSLSIGIDGLPVGVTPWVSITSGSQSLIVTSSATLSNLVPGTYTVSPQSVTLRRNVFDGAATSSTVSVVAGKTVSDAVNYGVEPGDLWLTRGNNGGPDEYLGSTLASGTPRTGTVISGLAYSYGMAFDAGGNLWVTDLSTTLHEYPVSSLGTGAPTPVTIDTGASGGLEGVAFDANGNLWVSNLSGTVVEYLAESLASGTPTTGTTIPYDPSRNPPTDLAFDASGNLWVAEPFDPISPSCCGYVVEYTAASLASGTPGIGSTITLGAVPDMGLAFDATGNLWVGLPASVVEYAASSLAGTSPTVDTTIDAGTNSYPVGPAFDASGNLWVAEQGSGRVVEYTAESLARGNPAVGGTIGVTTPIDIAFGPPPYDLPLSH